MSPSEEEEGKEQTSLPSLPSDTRRSKAGLQVSEERSEVAANKEVEQSEQLGALMCGFQGESGGGLEPVEFSEKLVVIRKSSASKCKDLSWAWKRSVNSLSMLPVRWKTMRSIFSCQMSWRSSSRGLRK